MYETRNDLSEPTRKSIVRLLNERLAEAIDLQLQAKHAHWNVKGPNFAGLHDFPDRGSGDLGKSLVDLDPHVSADHAGLVRFTHRRRQRSARRQPSSGP